MKNVLTFAVLLVAVVLAIIIKLVTRKLLKDIDGIAGTTTVGDLQRAGMWEADGT